MRQGTANPQPDIHIHAANKQTHANTHTNTHANKHKQTHRHAHKTSTSTVARPQRAESERPGLSADPSSRRPVQCRSHPARYRGSRRPGRPRSSTQRRGRRHRCGEIRCRAEEGRCLLSAGRAARSAGCTRQVTLVVSYADPLTESSERASLSALATLHHTCSVIQLRSRGVTSIHRAGHSHRSAGRCLPRRLATPQWRHLQRIHRPVAPPAATRTDRYPRYRRGVASAGRTDAVSCLTDGGLTPVTSQPRDVRPWRRSPLGAAAGLLEYVVLSVQVHNAILEVELPSVPASRDLAKATRRSSDEMKCQYGSKN